MPRRPDQDTFDAVDAFVESTLFALPDPALEAAQADADAAGLPQIQVTPAQSRLLEILIRAIGAQRILEFGTLAGYSTIAMARCLPEEGLQPAESDWVLAWLTARLEDPNLQIRWRWREGDVAIWDEYSTNHRALSDHYPQHRKMRRCTVDGSLEALGELERRS